MSQTGFEISEETGEDTMYVYTGIVTYDNGDEGQLEAVLVKVNDEWKILSVDIVVEEERLDNF